MTIIFPVERWHLVNAHTLEIFTSADIIIDRVTGRQFAVGRLVKSLQPGRPRPLTAYRSLSVRGLGRADILTTGVVTVADRRCDPDSGLYSLAVSYADAVGRTRTRSLPYSAIRSQTRRRVAAGWFSELGIIDVERPDLVARLILTLADGLPESRKDRANEQQR